MLTVDGSINVVQCFNVVKPVSAFAGWDDSFGDLIYGWQKLLSAIPGGIGGAITGVLDEVLQAVEQVKKNQVAKRLSRLIFALQGSR